MSVAQSRHGDAIRELIEAYAHCADRRDAKGQMALFTADTRFVQRSEPLSGVACAQGARARVR